MTRLAARLADSLLVLSMLYLAGCGSGGVSGPAVTTGTLAISPATAVVYTDVPAQFVITGGTAPYFVTSSNGTALPVPTSAFNYNTLTVVPGAVGADSAVTLSATDAKSSTTVSSTVTVKPRTISNVVTITPSANQSAACGTSLCAGGDAEVSVVLTQAGVPLAGRVVQFDVVSGDLRVIASAPGAPETLALSGTAVTDATGTARIRVRALTDATAQTALLRITDIASGFVQTASVSIAPSTSSPLVVQPTAIQFTGPDANTCASGVSADVLVIGGRPPYQVTQPPGFIVNPTVLTTSGRVTVTATGQCARTGTTQGIAIPDAGQTLAIVDATGATATVSIHNDPAPVTAVTVPFDVAPAEVTLDSCSAVAFVALVGGTGSYFGVGTNAVSVSASGNQGIIQRVPGTTASTSPISVAFSDGQTNKTVKVNLTGKALGGC
ncbi:MAG TPA: hypothetical protein VFE23_08730 [Usitatibacter sp.]|nr:hypothetical protein [Usitatibacter sp.]